MALTWVDIRYDSDLVLATPVPQLTVVRIGREKTIGLFDIRSVEAFYVQSPDLSTKYYDLTLKPRDSLRIAATPQELRVSTFQEAEEKTFFLQELQQICHSYRQGQLVDGAIKSNFTRYARWINDCLGVSIGVRLWDKNREIY
jgi:hypothetical protein